MEKNKLIIMRHAKSDWGAHFNRDFDRPLSKRGLRDAPRMGKWLEKHRYCPDLIVASPALRTYHTAQLVAAKLDLEDHQLVTEREIYDASLHDLLTTLGAYSKQAGVLMFVGHNPGVDTLVEYLSDGEPGYTRSGKLMTTAAIAVLEFEGEISVRQGNARLLNLVRPKEL